MSSNERIRIDLTDDQNKRVDHTSDTKDSPLGRGTKELQPRITPLVVIAIIAILIGLFIPVLQKIR